MDPAYHARKFEMMCREASSWTDRCVFSFVDMYGRTSRAGDLYRGPTEREADDFLRAASDVARDHGMTLSCCCPRRDLSAYGLENRGCIDAAMMRALDIPYETQDVPIRDGCRCVRSIDIGEYDTCGHDCVYCYANRSDPAVRRTRLYCDDTELLWGAVMPRDRVGDSRGRGSFRLDDFRPPNH